MTQTIWQDEAVLESELSPMQQAILRRHELQGHGPACVMTRAYRLLGQLHRKALDRALCALVSRHESLRTIYPLFSGRVTPRILPDTYFKVAYQDATHLGAPAEGFVDDLISKHGNTRFNLQQELPIRVEVVRLGAAEHALIITIHEIAADEGSWEILLDELEEAYSSFTGSPLPAEPPAEEDVELEAQFDVLPEASGEWLSKNVSLYELPDDSGIAPDLRPASIEEVSAPLPEPLYRHAKQYCTRSGVVLMVAILAAFGVMLFRYTRKEFVFVGKLVSGRTRDESKNVVGCLRQVVAIQANITHKAGFAQMLDHVSLGLQTGLLQGYVPVELLMREQASKAPPPFLQVMVEERVAREFKLAGLVVESLRRIGSSFQPDLKLIVEQHPAQVLLRVAFNARKVSRSCANRLLGHLQSVLEAGLSQPGRPVSTLAILAPNEERQILTDWNNTKQAFPLEKSYPVLFEEQVAQNPKAIAVRAGGVSLSFEELNGRANQLARHLQASGLGPNSIVGLCVERSVNLPAAMLAVWKAGAAYLPLDSSYPQSTLDYMVEDSKAAFVLTDASHANVCKGFPVQVVNVDEPDTRLAIQQQSPDNLPPLNGSSALAYVIYTSGSTGRPKGVQISHRSLVNHNLGIKKLFNLTSNDRVLQFSALSFDISVEEIFPTWLGGATLVFRPEKLFLTIDDFLDFVRREQITILNLPTAYWHELVNALAARRLPSAVRIMVIGGEQASQKHYAEWERYVGHSVKLINGYGLTETTVTSTTFLGDAPVGRGVPIGRPLANTQAYILDENLQPVPSGVIGELYVGGEGVALGYLNRPELTAEKFIPNPFSDDPQSRLCRTGDRALFLEDGNILFLGRADDQLKIRGFRIEPGQIEEAFVAHPEVRQCKILAQDAGDGEKRLVAYVVHSDNIDLAQLRVHLRDRLPEHMIPASIIRLDALPLTPNGKVDKRALPSAEGPSIELVESSGAIEERIASIWRKVFGNKVIKTTDTFVELGGHSLLALRLMTEIERQLGRKIPPGGFSENTTIAQLAQALGDTAPVSGFEHLVPLQENGDHPPLYLIHGIGGGMLWGYQNLAKYLGSDQPVYFLRSRGLEGSPEYQTVEEMAAAYVQEIRRHRPVGPYALGGYCFAGNVAYEMACQLAEDGQRVSQIILLNAMAPNSDYYKVRVTPAFVWRFLQNTYSWVRHFRTWDREVKRDFIARKWRTLAKAAIGSKAGAMPAEEIMNLSGYTRLEKELWNTHLQAWERHVPRTYRGNVILFRTRIHPFWCTFAEDFGWRQFVPENFTVKIIPGQHANILQEPYVEGLASEITQALAADSDLRDLSCKPIEV